MNLFCSCLALAVTFATLGCSQPDAHRSLTEPTTPAAVVSESGGVCAPRLVEAASELEKRVTAREIEIATLVAYRTTSRKESYAEILKKYESLAALYSEFKQSFGEFECKYQEQFGVPKDNEPKTLSSKKFAEAAEHVARQIENINYATKNRSKVECSLQIESLKIPLDFEADPYTVRFGRSFFLIETADLSYVVIEATRANTALVMRSNPNITPGLLGLTLTKVMVAINEDKKSKSSDVRISISDGFRNAIFDPNFSSLKEGIEIKVGQPKPVEVRIRALTRKLSTTSVSAFFSCTTK